MGRAGLVSVRVGVVVIPDGHGPELVDRFVECEARGFEFGWTYDHLSWRSLRDGPWLGAVPLLAAVAARTSTMRIGPLVATPNYRHPALLAKDVMTIDRLSEGRFELGLGAGGAGFDAVVFGTDPPALPERAARFEEFTAALDQMLREPITDVDSTRYRVVGSRTVPGCVQRPRVPFTIGAAGPRALDVTARYAARWVTYGPLGSGAVREEWLEAVKTQTSALDRACERAGRDPRSLERLALVNLEVTWATNSIAAFDDLVGELESRGFTDIAIHWPRPHDPELPGPAPAVFDEISQRLA
jgi:alkanesulfonate monooxygenase SsuD/methylene tetrahydromethanopterin reductase-like flavin-dependent oxidoreductase (luciferase family)